MGQANSGGGYQQQQDVPGYEPDKPRRRLRRGAERRQNPFLQHGEAVDHIVPIREGDRAETVRPDAAEGDLEGALDVSDLMQRMGRAGLEDEDRGPAMPAFPTAEAESSSGDDEDGAPRGLYHWQIEKQHSVAGRVTDADSHPISVSGDLCVGNELSCVDNSNWREQFPLHRVRWHLGASIGSRTTFLSGCLSETGRVRVPPNAVGRFIQLVGTRRVEDQLAGTHAVNVEGGVFDPHSRRAAKTSEDAPRKFVVLDSHAIVGPILISRASAVFVLQHFARGSMRIPALVFDVQLRKEAEAANVKAQRRPATLCANFSHLLLSYEWPNRVDPFEGDGTTTLTGALWLAHVNRTARRIDASSVEYTAQMDWRDLILRPSQVIPDGIVLAVNSIVRGKSVGFERGFVDVVTFAVDPKVGQLQGLQALLSFAGANESKKTSIPSWADKRKTGDHPAVMRLFQMHLLKCTSKGRDMAPCFEL